MFEHHVEVRAFKPPNERSIVLKDESVAKAALVKRVQPVPHTECKASMFRHGCQGDPMLKPFAVDFAQELRLVLLIRVANIIRHDAAL